MELLKRPLLLLVLATVLFIIVNFLGFLENVVFYATGQAANWVIHNQWPLVFINIALFLLFLV